MTFKGGTKIQGSTKIQGGGHKNPREHKNPGGEQKIQGGGAQKNQGGAVTPFRPPPLNETLVKVQGENLSCPRKMFGVIDGEERRIKRAFVNEISLWIYYIKNKPLKSNRIFLL